MILKTFFANSKSIAAVYGVIVLLAGLLMGATLVTHRLHSSTPSTLAPDEPAQLKFDDATRAIQYEHGAWHERFSYDSFINTHPALTVVVWWLLIALIGWLVFPLVFALTPGLADRGYAFIKIAGLFLTGWLAWVAASLRIPLWSRGGLLVALVLVAVLSAAAGWRARGDLGAFLRARWRLMLGYELIALVAFLAFLGVRLMHPDLWQYPLGNEKPMDFAYLTAILRSTYFPPIDPWYAGGFINYYYFGFVIAGVPVLLLGVLPSVAYNLLIPTMFAMTAIGAFSVAFNLVAGHEKRRGSPWLAGAAALIMMVVLGNLSTPGIVLGRLAEMGAPSGFAPGIATVPAGIGRVLSGEPLVIQHFEWFWLPTRILSGEFSKAEFGITESPSFTFMGGDLHAHMISLPLQLLVLGLLLNEVLVATKARDSLAEALALAFTALLVGMFRAVNTWELPTYLALGAAAIFFAWWLSRPTPVWRLALRLVVFVFLSAAFAYPYTVWYASIYTSASLWQGFKTPVTAYLIVHGLFLFLIVTFLLTETRRHLTPPAADEHEPPADTAPYKRYALFALIGAGVILGVVLALLGTPTPLLSLPLLAWTAILLFRPAQPPITRAVLALVGLALCLTIAVEFIALDGDQGRQNTVFKFYVQVWLMFSVVSGAVLAWLMPLTAQWRRGARTAWFGGLALLVATGALFPITTVLTRAPFRLSQHTPLTLDGMAYLQYTLLREANPNRVERDPGIVPYRLADDYAMIRWLQDIPTGTPVIIEGRGTRDYTWQARISVYTGTPGILGWGWHQYQQRTLDHMQDTVLARLDAINEFYSTTDIDAALDILRRYQVDYVIVGGFEWANYPPAGIAKFETMTAQGLLEVAFRVNASTIYRVVKP